MEVFEKRIQELEERLDLNEKRMQLVLGILNTTLSKEETTATPRYEPVKPAYDLAKELQSRAIQCTPIELNDLKTITRHYTDEQIGYVLTKIARQSKIKPIHNICGYTKRALAIEYPEVLGKVIKYE